MVDSFRRKFPGRLAQHVEPHITILPPAEYENASTLERGLGKALETIPDFSIRLGEPGYFGKRVLFLSVLHDEARLNELRNNVLTEVNRSRMEDGLAPIEDNRPFYPHLTLAMASFGTSYSNMQDMEVEARLLSSSFQPFTVQTLQVYVRGSKGWQTWMRFSLNKK